MAHGSIGAGWLQVVEFTAPNLPAEAQVWP